MADIQIEIRRILWDITRIVRSVPNDRIDRRLVRPVGSHLIHRAECPQLRFVPDARLTEQLTPADNFCTLCFPEFNTPPPKRTQQPRQPSRRKSSGNREKTPGLHVAASYGSGVHAAWSPEGHKIAALLAEDHDSNWLESAEKAWES